MTELNLLVILEKNLNRMTFLKNLRTYTMVIETLTPLNRTLLHKTV